MAQQRFQQLLEFLTTLTEVNGDSANTMDQRRRLLRSCLHDFVTGPPVTMSEDTAMRGVTSDPNLEVQATQIWRYKRPPAPAMLRQVQNSSIPQWMKDEVISSLENKMVQNEDASSARTDMQKNMFLYNYFDEKEWGVLMNENNSLDPKLHVIKGRCIAIGLAHPTEPTFVLANAILHIASHTGPIENLQVDSQKSLAVLKELKTMVKLGCKRDQHSGIVFYPADPRDLPQATRENAYRHGPAAQCPLDVKTITDLTATLPGRDTHHEIRSRRSFRSRSLCDENMGAMLGNWVCNNLFAGFAQGGGGNGFNLQMLGNGTPKRKRSQLAIEDAVPHEATPGPKEVAPKPDDNQEPGVEKQSAQASNPKGIDGMAASIADQLVANSNEKKDKSKKYSKSKGEGQRQSAKDCFRGVCQCEVFGFPRHNCPGSNLPWRCVHYLRLSKIEQLEGEEKQRQEGQGLQLEERGSTDCVGTCRETCGNAFQVKPGICCFQ